MIRVEVASLMRPFSGKDHDRIFTDDERHIYAVFDGAGNGQASQTAMYALQEAASTLKPFKVDAALRMVHDKVMRYCGGGLLTTGILVHLGGEEERPRVHYASAGDSRLYHHRGNELTRLTFDESQRFGNRIDASNFLGSKLHTLRQIGSVGLRSADSLVLVSDGITDDFYKGYLTDQSMNDILTSSDTAEAAAKEIMNQTAAFDDASVIIISIL